MMVRGQRQQLHLNVARYYENLLNENNRHKLLIPLYEHYSETDDKHRLKKIRYLEAVSHFYYEKHSMVDAIKVLLSINGNLYTSFPKNSTIFSNSCIIYPNFS